MSARAGRGSPPDGNVQEVVADLVLEAAYGWVSRHRFRAAGLTLARATVDRFAERAARLFEHRVEGLPAGAYATRRLTWVTAGVRAGPRFHDARLLAASTIDGTLLLAEEHGSEPYAANAGLLHRNRPWLVM